MCTLVILRRPDSDWPLLLGANRDELLSRSARPPGRHWPDRPEVVAGLDCSGGGSWLGMNDYGLVAAVMNRENSLGPAPGKRSRGELVLEALDHLEARDAVGALSDLHPSAYRPFNLVVADRSNAYWLRHGDDGEIRVHPIPPGLHMLSATELDDLAYPRVRSYLPQFRAAEAPDPEEERWNGWMELLASRTFAAEMSPAAAMNLALPGGFGTVSSALIALPASAAGACVPLWLHAEGPPDRAPYLPVALAREVADEAIPHSPERGS